MDTFTYFSSGTEAFKDDEDISLIYNEKKNNDSIRMFMDFVICYLSQMMMPANPI
jgi:hypothetical protein